MPRPSLSRPVRRGLATVLAAGLTATLFSAAASPSGANEQPGVLPGEAHAQWIDTDTVVWPVDTGPETTEQLVYDVDGALTAGAEPATGNHRLRLAPTELTDEQRARYPHLSDWPAFAVDTRDADRTEEALRGQLLATQRTGDGSLTAATGVQIPGVLDDLYADAATHADLGPVFDEDGTPTLSLWAPTAREVSLRLGDHTTAMDRDDTSGVWSVTGEPGWAGQPYRYQVTVWAPEAQRIVTHEVTDPYSTALTADGAQSLLTDLRDPALAPSGWEDLVKPEPVGLSEAAIQELHVRDFSIGDATSAYPGKYLAFTESGTDGTRHLRDLAEAGTTHAHLLPTYDMGSIPERPQDQREPACDLAELPADSERQQECVAETRDDDAYNWGYDPVHFNVPEGSYATDPEGPARTLEHRRMVQALNGAGLRVVVDVVYNHTFASGQDEKSVLDRIVPGYYHRLLDDGSVADSTCCPGTAPEHAMMGKLVADSVVLWAQEYKVDGFRFDLMGHHPKQNMLDIRAALDELTIEEHGVDGQNVIIYGEGWNFGEIENDARFEQATQENMAGTGIGTFSDRARDAVRGGSPFDEDPRVQGFASGLYSDPNSSPANGDQAEQRSRLLHYQDQIKVGLSGNLAGYVFTDSRGERTTGAEVDYNGSPAGYAVAPGEAIAYVDKHDNETLFDTLAYKLPPDTSPADRARTQVVAQATALLSQGAVFGQAGTDLLRSKSLDRNSYDSGDWYNAINWSCQQSNGFGRGLPPAWDNEDKWGYAAPLLTNPALRMGCSEITGAADAYRDLLTIRATEDAFGLTSLEKVQEQVGFPVSGTAEEVPGVIVMEAGHLAVVFNATPHRQFAHADTLVGKDYTLHPVQAAGADEVVTEADFAADQGTFEVPPRTVAVFTSD